MARFKFGRKVSLRWNGLLIEGPAETTFEIPDEYYEEFEQDIHPVEPTLVWLDSDEGATLRARVTVLEAGGAGGGASLSNNTPVALGTAAPGSGTTASRHDHVHPTTGLSLSGHNHDASYSGIAHNHTGVYDPAGTAAAAVTAHEAASDPHPTYLTDAEGDAQYSQLGHTHTTAGYTTVIKQYVKNDSTPKSKGEAVYISSADGTNPIVSYADADTEATSSKTLGLLEQDLTANEHGWVVTEGVLTNINTSAATAGQSVWLSGTAGGRVYGAPPAEPAHGVYLGVVTKANASTGEIFVKVQNGYELNELHDVSTGSAVAGDLIQYDGSMWNNKSLSAAGISSTSHDHNGVYSDTSHSHSGLVPVGGTTGQVLSKVSGTNYDVTWSTSSGGGASLSNTNAVALGTAAAGTASEASRQDHVHPTTSLATLTGTETLTNKTLTLPSIDNTKTGYTTTVSSATVISLTNTSTYLQIITGSATQNINLPDTTTMSLGQGFKIYNEGTSSVIIRTSASTVINTIYPTMTAEAICVLTSGTTAASWSIRYSGGQVVGAAATGAGPKIVFNQSPDLITPSFSGTSIITGIRSSMSTVTTSATPIAFATNSNYYRKYIGSVAQIINMNAFHSAGDRYELHNLSSANITVNASGGSAIALIRPNEAYLVICNTTNTTTPSGWSVYMISGGSPVGTVNAYLGSNASIPTGWLLCDGSIVSRTTYFGLFAVIGTTFGAGDGSTTFGLPDLTGHMLVGASVTAPTQTGTGDSYLNATWDHNHIHSHVTNPAATTSGTASANTVNAGGTGVTPTAQSHTHSTDIAATTSDTDSTAMSTSPTQKRTRVNYIIKT